ncbi:GGDEF domain-containing protein [Bacillus sp. FJAT-49732]|uniref:GGDEF domain-containing protein n=1 Tax=Lederbergia citrisecunda TaxID=2833583 RepID=A0A942YM74_9BACI|nr:GGDEF domain-containing protein [Lederbergia citrisecunda]MBS4201169.1 GGDEF domain-containing protein [Lederbergia citrisecunda]
MNIFLDTKTIILLLGIGYLFTIILIFVYGLNHTKGATTKTFFIAKSFQTIVLFCMVYRGEIPDFLSIFLANSLLFIGMSLEVIALLSLQNGLRNKTKMFYFFMNLFGIIGFLLIFLFYNKEYVRIAYCSFITMAILFPVYRMVIGKVPTLLMRTIGSLYLLFIAGNLVRGLTALLSSSISTSFYTPGSYQLISLLSIYLLINLGNIGFFLLIKEKSDSELVRLASYDDLTGTLNRRTFTENAKQYLINYAKKGQPLSYFLFDVDSFKTINDTYGHQVGDQVLQDLTTRIKQYLSKDDLFVRYGGDEFGILMPGKDEGKSNEIAQQITQTFNEVISPNLPVTYTISIGVLTVIPNQYTQLENLYTTCDKALYKAKNNGRNGIFRSQIEEQHAVS